MLLLTEIDLKLPLSNPVIIFSLVLFVILFAPIAFNKIKVPHIIGLIMAGVVIGPYGFNLLLRDSSIVLFSTVGLLYIMFTAGLEIDLEEFRKNRVKSVVFGLFTFLIPVTLGWVAAYYLLRFSVASSLLMASLFASHTLLAYPIASRYGIARLRAVTLTIGGTIFTDVLSLLLLAAVIGGMKGDIGTAFWLRLGISAIIFASIIFFIFPLIARWFFKRFDDSISQYIFVLAMVFLGSFLAEVAGLEAIIGAFLSGLALNRFIPHSSALMNRIDFVGNAIFIPFFLIGVGMLVDFRVIFKGWEAIGVATVMIVVAVLSKYLAAVLTQRSFRLSGEERQLIFGLSTARVGATLAVVLVGYNFIIGETESGEPIRLLSENVLNGTVLMILVTCTISSFVTEKTAQKLALQEENKEPQKEAQDNILISLVHVEDVEPMVDLGLMLKAKKSTATINALHIVSEENNDSKEHVKGKKMMEKVQSKAAAIGQKIVPISRHDANTVNGIVYTAREQNVTDILLELEGVSKQNNFIGAVAEKVIQKVFETVYVYKSKQPINTLKRMLVLVPQHAEFEPGFGHWLSRLMNIAKEAGLAIVFYAGHSTSQYLQSHVKGSSAVIKADFKPFDEWEDFLIFSRELKADDLFVVVLSRENNTSYDKKQDKVPYHLNRYFRNNSIILLFPRQVDHSVNMGDIEQADGTLIETISEKADVVRKAGRTITKLIKKGRR